jgi:hypothetical protein
MNSWNAEQSLNEKVLLPIYVEENVHNTHQNNGFISFSAIKAIIEKYESNEPGVEFWLKLNAFEDIGGEPDADIAIWFERMETDEEFEERTTQVERNINPYKDRDMDYELTGW